LTPCQLRFAICATVEKKGNDRQSRSFAAMPGHWAQNAVDSQAMPELLT
jgi:hypothetical protein